MNKKVILLLICLMVLSLSACGAKNTVYVNPDTAIISPDGFDVESNGNTSNGEDNIPSASPKMVDLTSVKDIMPDTVYEAKSSWANGSWCAVDKESVTGIRFVEKYEGEAAIAWMVDDVLCCQAEDGIVYVSAGNGINMVGSMESAFAQFRNEMTIEGLEKINTSAVTNLSRVFSYSGFKAVDISMWDTSNVKDFSHMVSRTDYLSELNISNLDLSSVTDLSYMLEGCLFVKNLYMENIDTSHIVNMEGMFSDVGSLLYEDSTTIHGTIDTSNVTNMSYMFYQARLPELSAFVSNFDTSNVTNMNFMFMDCAELRELDLSHFDVSKVTSMQEMFANVGALADLNMEGWAPSILESTHGMFSGCTNLRVFNQWQTAPNIKWTTSMFAQCFSLHEADITCFDGATIEYADEMFIWCDALRIIYSNGFTLLNPNENMFESAIAIEGPTAYSEANVGSSMATTSGYFTAK